MKSFKRDRWAGFALLGLVAVWTWGAIAVAQDKLGQLDKPAPEVQQISEVEDLRLTVQIKDFQLAQMKFASTIADIKKAHGWGDDVMYDFNQNKFYRLPKPPVKQTEKK